MKGGVFHGQRGMQTACGAPSMGTYLSFEKSAFTRRRHVSTLREEKFSPTAADLLVYSQVLRPVRRIEAHYHFFLPSPNLVGIT